MGAAALPLALNHVESKWACAIPARVLARKDPSNLGGIGLSKLPNARCAVISTPPSKKNILLQTVTTGPGKIQVGPAETEFQGHLRSSYDAGPDLVHRHACVAWRGQFELVFGGNPENGGGPKVCRKA
jgi:hypothetical protein